MTTRKKWILFFIVTAVPIIDILFPFFCGLFDLSPDYIIFLIPWVLFGPIVAGILIAALIPNTSLLKKIAIAIGTGIGTYITVFASFFLVNILRPPWTVGVATNFVFTKHPGEVQQWASKVLDQFENGALEVTTNSDAEDFMGGRAKLEDKEVPPQIRNLWRQPPTIGIVTITDNGWIADPIRAKTAIIPDLTGGASVLLHLSHCVAFSWHNWGLLVGNQDFKSNWDPGGPGGDGLIQQIRPGIYVFTFGH